MASFDGATFDERGQGNGTFFPIHGIKIEVAILKIPGGSKSYLQSLGVPAQPFDLPIKATAAQLDALRGKVNTSGNLAYSFGTFTATLQEVSSPIEIKRGADYYFATLKLLIESPFP